MIIFEVKAKIKTKKELKFVLFPVSSGWIKLIYTDEFLHRVEFKRSLRTKERDWEAEFSKALLPDWLVELKEALKAYFKGVKVSFSAPLDLGSLPLFYQKVYLTAQEIPYGETRSYKWIATRIGNQNAARAVGQALKNNPFLVVVPCHRVVKSDGSLGGWSGARGLKEELLRLERTVKNSNQSLKVKH